MARNNRCCFCGGLCWDWIRQITLHTGRSQWRSSAGNLQAVLGDKQWEISPMGRTNRGFFICWKPYLTTSTFRRMILIPRQKLPEKLKLNCATMEMKSYRVLPNCIWLKLFKKGNREQGYYTALKQMLDKLLQIGRNEDGIWYYALDAATEKPLKNRLCDNWGYLYNGYYTFYLACEKRQKQRDPRGTAKIYWCHTTDHE